MTKFGHQDFFARELAQLHREGRYRVFADLERVAHSNIYAFDHRTGRRVTTWCSNVYLLMGVHDDVIGAARDALEQYRAGAGGTRNISGTSHEHVQLLQRRCIVEVQKDRRRIDRQAHTSDCSCRG